MLPVLVTRYWASVPSVISAVTASTVMIGGSLSSSAVVRALLVAATYLPFASARMVAATAPAFSETASSTVSRARVAVRVPSTMVTGMVTRSLTSG